MAAPEYEIGGYYWITLTEPGLTSDQYVYKGRAYNTTLHILEARHHPGKYVTMSNTRMEKFAERMYDRPKKDEIWERVTNSGRANPLYFLSSINVADVVGDWVIFSQPFDTRVAAATARHAMLLSDFTKKYRKAEPA
jgi:hypothetical protein